MSFLLDTDICSAHMKGHRRVSSRFVQYGGNLRISTVSLGELLVWSLRIKAPPKRARLLVELLREVQVLPVDEAVARKFGEVRAWQLDHGLATPDLDLLNGAMAIVHGLTLVTHNTADYTNVPGLQLVDWLST